jgi:hypothetical protein
VDVFVHDGEVDARLVSNIIAILNNSAYYSTYDFSGTINVKVT